MQSRQVANPGRVIRFSNPCSKQPMLKCPLKTVGAATSSKRSPSSIAHCVGAIPERLLLRLRKLDPEQLQIVEIVVVAIQRGAICWLISLPI